MPLLVDVLQPVKVPAGGVGERSGHVRDAIRPRPRGRLDQLGPLPEESSGQSAARLRLDRAQPAAAVGAEARRRVPRAAAVGSLLLTGLVAMTAAAKAILFDTLDPDCFWHLRVAGQLRADGIGPLVDRLSFASIQVPWTPYSWLAELGMKAVWDCAGWRGAVATQAIVQALFVAAAALACRAARPAASPRCRFLPAPGASGCGAAEPSRWAAILATAAVAFLSLPYLSFRPVTAALVLLALCAWLLVRDRAGGERTWGVWAVLPMTAVTTNLHLYSVFVPAWVAALLLGALWERCLVALPAERPEADRRVARYFILLLGTAVACMATPMLLGVVTTAVHYEYADPMVASGRLWEMSPFFLAGAAGRVAGGVVAAVLLLALVRLRRLRPGEFLWLVASLFILSRMGRFAPVFAIAAGPIIAVTLPRGPDRLLARPGLWATAAAALVIGVNHLVRVFPAATTPMASWVNRQGPDGMSYPCAAADFVARNVPAETGRLVSEFNWGGYLEWRLGDRYQLFLDGRTQLFTPEFWRATYLGTAREQQQFLSQVRADAAVVPVNGSIFRHSLVRLGWRPVYRDEQAEVLVPSEVESSADGRWSPMNALLSR